MKKICFLFLIVFGLQLVPSSELFGQDKSSLYPYFGNLIGTWRMETERGTLMEEWEVLDETHFQGKSSRMLRGDTTEIEEVILSIEDGKIWYQPLVYDQNGGKRIVFIEKYLGSTKEGVEGKQAHSQVTAIFTKPDHDYPKFIRYNISDRSLVVTISNQEDMKNGHEFVFEKSR